MVQTFLINGIGYSREQLEASGGQSALAAAHADGGRALCQCRSSGVPMYVRRIGDRFTLARMPEGGLQHARGCPSFEDPDVLSGLGSYPKGTFTRRDDGSVSIVFALDIPSGQETSPTGQARYFSLAGLLHFLWSEAGFNHWHPGFEGKRNWWLIRHRLMEAVSTISLGDRSLRNLIFVPDQFNKQTIDAETQSCRDVVTNCGKYALVLAPLASFSQAKFGYSVTLKHLPDLKFWFADGAADDFAQRYRRELSLIGHDEDYRLVGLFAVEAKQTGNLHVIDGALMPVTGREWIPCETRYDCILARALVEQGRSFIKNLRYDAPVGDVFPEFHLLDVGDASVPMEVIIATSATPQGKRKRERVHYYQESGEPHWVWDITVSGRLPAFPSKDSIRAGSQARTTPSQDES